MKEKWERYPKEEEFVPFVSQITLLITGFGIMPFHTAKVTVLSSI